MLQLLQTLLRRYRSELVHKLAYKRRDATPRVVYVNACERWLPGFRIKTWTAQKWIGMHLHTYLHRGEALHILSRLCVNVETVHRLDLLLKAERTLSVTC